MATPLGLRQVKVFNAVPANTSILIDSGRGAFLYHEVTNGTAGVINFTVNDNPDGGMIGVAIPIPANSTRAIPMALYNFKADGIVTVVSYGM